MMVNCPKCGFSQPKDQYCAKCGVDMVAFRPAEKPLTARIFGNTFFQLFLLIALIGTGFGYIRYQNQSHLATRIAELDDTESTRLLERPLARSDSASQGEAPAAEASSGSIDEASTDDVADASSDSPGPAALSAPNPAPSHQNAPGEPEARTLVAQNTGAPKSPSDPTNPVANPAGSGAANLGAAEDRASAPTNIRIVFAEIQKPFLSEIIASAQDGGGYGNFNSGVIANLDSQIKSASGAIRTLESDTTQPLRLNQMIPIYKGTVDESIGQNIGLTLEITPFPAAPDEPNTRLSIKSRRIFRDPRANPPIDQLAFPEDQYSVPRGSAVFLSGLLPKRPIQDDEARLYNTVDVLKILSLDSYRNGMSDFIVFIEPK